MAVFAKVTRGRKVYFWRQEIEGKTYKRTVGPRRDECEADMIRFRDNFKRGGIQAADPERVPTLEKFKDRFLQDCRERETKASTVAAYTRRLDRMITSNLGGIPLAKITLADWTEYVDARRAEAREGEKSTVAINRERELLRNVLNTAHHLGVLTAPSTLRPRKLKGERRRDYAPSLPVLRAYLEAAESTSLYGIPAPLLYAAALLSATTGARLGEIARLHRDEITATPAGFLWKVRDGKSEAASWPQEIPKKSRAFQVLRDLLQESAQPFLINPDPEETVRRISKAHRKLADRLKISEDFVFHSLRHLAITVRAYFEPNPIKLRAFSRHTDIRTTAIYCETDRLAEAPKVRALLGA
jgi:integrase